MPRWFKPPGRDADRWGRCRFAISGLRLTSSEATAELPQTLRSDTGLEHRLCLCCWARLAWVRSWSAGSFLRVFANCALGCFLAFGLSVLLVAGVFADVYRVRVSANGSEVSAGFLADFLAGALYGPLAAFRVAVVGTVPVCVEALVPAPSSSSPFLDCPRPPAQTVFWLVIVEFRSTSHRLYRLVRAGVLSALAYQLTNLVLSCARRVFEEMGSVFGDSGTKSLPRILGSTTSSWPWDYAAIHRCVLMRRLRPQWIPNLATALYCSLLPASSGSGLRFQDVYPGAGSLGAARALFSADGGQYDHGPRPEG